MSKGGIDVLKLMTHGEVYIETRDGMTGDGRLNSRQGNPAEETAKRCMPRERETGETIRYVWRKSGDAHFVICVPKQ